MSRVLLTIIPLALAVSSACRSPVAPSSAPPLFPLSLRSIGGQPLPRPEFPGGRIIIAEVVTLRVSPTTGGLIFRRETTMSDGTQTVSDELATYDSMTARLLPRDDHQCGPADNCFVRDWVGQFSDRELILSYTVRGWPAKDYIGPGIL